MQIFFKEKNIPKYIINNIELSFDSDKEKSDKKNSNEENSVEKMKVFVIYIYIYIFFCIFKNGKEI